MLNWGKRNDDMLALARIIQSVHRAPRHKPLWQVIGNVAQPHQSQLFQRLHQLRANAIKAIGLGKQGIEDFRTHNQSLTCNFCHCEEAKHFWPTRQSIFHGFVGGKGLKMDCFA